MVLLEAAAVVGLFAVLVFASLRLLMRPAGERATTTRPGRWRVAHYDKAGLTRVVVQKVSGAGTVLDEHLVATVPVADPEYDAQFLAAMSTARERRALFEAEEDS